MKIQADSLIYGELIPVPSKIEQEKGIESQLQKISEEILEQIQLHKKKSYKEKELNE